MRYSQVLIPTVKEVPAEAEVPSHQLMIRAGLIRKLASGTYTYLPLGWKCLRKIMEIVRQEMDAAGAQEISMPILQPIELWQQTGRDVDYGPNLCQFQDRHGRVNALSPTAEEVVTSLVAGEVSSYKQLPINLYQIGPKFRDEFRPRFGVLRSREFIMKDAYSFHTSLEDLDAGYRKMYDAYCRIFRRCGLKYVVVEAESGPIGGSASHEFMVPCPTGEDVIVHTDDFSYAANIEKAQVDPPAAAAGTGQQATGNGQQAAGTGQQAADLPPMEEVHTPGVGSIEAVCRFLGTQPRDMIKTLIYGNQDVVLALVRGDHEVNQAKLAHVAGCPVELADPPTIERISGASVGFAGPMGACGRVAKMVIDPSVAAMPVAVTGANKTDYHMKYVVPGRDFPLSGPNVVVADIRSAAEGDTHGGRPLRFSHGIEVGHVFKLGAKYSEALGARILDEKGASRPCLMGCYGIGINRILASAIEMDSGHDDGGCILPISIAPFEAEVLPLNADKPPVVREAERIYNELKAAGADVLLDDRDVRPGVKFKDADLIGIPLRVVVGEKSLKDGKVEIKRRTDAKPTLVPAGEAVTEALKALREMKEALAPK